MSCSTPEHPSRPFLDQGLCEHSAVLVGRGAKWAPRCDVQLVYGGAYFLLNTISMKISFSHVFSPAKLGNDRWAALGGLAAGCGAATVWRATAAGAVAVRFGTAVLLDGAATVAATTETGTLSTLVPLATVLGITTGAAGLGTTGLGTAGLGTAGLGAFAGLGIGRIEVVVFPVGSAVVGSAI